MTPEETAERSVAIEHEAKALRTLIEEHVKDEEAWRVGHDKKIDAVYEVLVGARGAAKVLGWVIAGLGMAAASWSWIVHNLHVSVK